MSRELRLRLPPESVVRYRVSDEAGESLPAKISLSGGGGAPLEGAPGRIPPRGAYYTATGSGTLRLPAGD